MTRFPLLLSPIDVGTMPLRNRVMMPPHTAPLGPLWSSEDEAAQNIEYIRRRCEAGVAWIVNITGHIDNLFVPGFTPVGIGARTKGYFRLPVFHDRVQAYTEAIHSAGSFTTVQLVSQGGLPNAPSATLSSPVLNAVPHVLDRDEIRWYVRMRGEEKEFTTIWITLGQRTLRYETYVMPAPEENAAELYESVLRRNERLVGAHFSIGAEDAIFLRGELPLALVCEPELDRIVGTMYDIVERAFPSLIRIGFASRFTDDE